jgi:hypothetical protein
MRFFLIGLLFLAGCTFYLGNEIPSSAEDGLKNADWAVLYTLAPEKSAAAGEKELDGFPVKDKVVLVKDDAAEAAADVEDAIDSVNGSNHCVFKPDHALRVRQDYHTYDFLLSYDCGLVEIFEDHHSVAWHGMSGSPEDLDAIMAAYKIRPKESGK